MNSWPPWLFVSSVLLAVGAGVIGGVFYAFSTFVMKALARLTPPEGIRAMQHINVVVLNPMFLSVFLGTAAAGLAVAAGTLWHRHLPGAAWLLAGGLLYVVGTFGVTIVGNVPLNDALAAVDPQTEQGTDLWSRYLRRWTIWNHVRTVAGVAAMVATLLGIAIAG